ncbi:MAG: coenzyme F420-0:L-glutamate ligase [Candidatus Bathyarchaeia archaeon]
MRLIAVKTRVVKAGDDLVELVLEALKSQGLQLENNDVLALTSKVVSFSEGRTVKLSEVKPSEEAKRLAREYSLKPEFAELILREADRVCGGVERAVLTLKNGVMAANAGIDNKNAPSDYAVLWPKDPAASAREVRDRVKSRTGKDVAVIIVDSGLVPLRIGTTGLALAVAGFKPIRDSRGCKDLFGKSIVITRQAVADDLASAAHLLMGEATEKTPLVLIKDAPVDFDGSVYGSADMMMPFKECIFMNTLGTQSGVKKKARA